MNDELRNSMWNFIHSLFESPNEYLILLAKWVAQFFRKVPVDEIPYHDYDCRNWVKDYLFSLPWYKVYDFIEFVVDNYEDVFQYPIHTRTELNKSLTSFSKVRCRVTDLSLA